MARRPVGRRRLRGAAPGGRSGADRAWASASEVYFDTELTLGRHTEVVAELRQATRRSPLREGLWAQLMLALYRDGRQAEALDAFHRLATILAEELGVDPGPAVRELRDRVLRADSALSWRPPSAAATATPAAPPMSLLRPTSACCARSSRDSRGHPALHRHRRH